VLQEGEEVRVVGVTGAAEVVALDAIEMLLERGREDRAPRLPEKELGDVFERNPDQLSAHQPA
jgi:hypothetical protein